MSAQPVISLRGFDLGFQTSRGIFSIVEEVDLDIPEGELILLLGPSGSGKSSLLAAILGLDDPYRPSTSTRGELRVLGERVRGPLPAALKRRIGALFQDGALIDDLSPEENVRIAVREAGGGSVEELLRRTGLSAPPATVAALSGGQRKRVALARALARDPELLVLDEPTAGLDPPGATAVAKLIREVHDGRAGRSTIVVSHDITAFRPIADRGLLLDPTRGRLTLVDKENLADVHAQVERIIQHPSAPPPLVRQTIPQRTLRAVSRVLLLAADLLRLIPAALRHLVPYHLGMLGRGLLDQLLSPALFLAVAAATTGALATCFSLRNNPLEGAFRREVLMGNGKVLVTTALPLIVGVLYAARNAAGATARIGSLRLSQVFEALPLIGVSPHAFLLTPLLLSGLIAATVLTALGLVAGCLAGLWVTQLTTSISPFAWASATFHAVDGTDLRWVLLKALATGAATALTAFALAARRKTSAQDVADATNSAIVWSSLWVLLFHGGLTLAQFGV